MNVAEVAKGAAQAGAFLLEHRAIVEDMVKALASGAPAEAIQAAIRGTMIAQSDAAIAEELHAAEARRP